MSVILAFSRHHCDLAEADLLETRMLTAPAAASQLNFDSVGMEVRIQATTAATATNTAVQVPCSDTALSPIDTLRMAEPATKIQSEVPNISIVQRECEKLWLSTHRGRTPPQALPFRSVQT